MSNSHHLYLDVRMATFKGDAVRILSFFDIRNNVLMVSELMPFRPSSDESHLTPEQVEQKRAAERDTLVVTDSPDAFDHWDIAFIPNEHLDAAANAYITYKRQGVLNIDDELAGRANVDNVLDARKLELTKGIVWQLDPQSTNNLHVAILGLCYAAKRATAGAGVVSILDEKEDKDVHDDSVMPFTI